MFQPFALAVESRGQYELLLLKGYLEDSAGICLKEHVNKSLDAGISLFAMDFSGIELISSPGVAALLDVAGSVVDDFAGSIAVWGLDKHHSTVLEMSGFFFMAHQVADEAEGVAYLSGD